MTVSQLHGLRSCRSPATAATANFGEFFSASVRLDPDKPALLEGERTVSYAELDRRCNQVAHLLSERGVGRGDRVALLFENQIEVIELTFGTMRAGAVPVPLNSELAENQLARIAGHCEADVLIAGGSLQQRAKRILGRMRDVPRIVLVDADRPDVGESYPAARRAADPEHPAVAVSPDDICMMPYTSGSSGEPKGVLLTHGGCYWCVNMLRRVMLLEPSERALVAVPLYHKNGMLGAVKPFLMAGGSVVLLRSFDAAGALRAIERHRVTYVTGVPAMYRLMIQELKADRFDLSSLDWGIVGSAEVPSDLFAEVEAAFGMRLVESYGITEGGPEVALTPRWGVRRSGWSGLVVPGVEARIVDPDDPSEEVEYGAIGELLVRSPGVAKGYYKSPAVTALRFLEDGWLRTGDLACLDERGYLKIVGRIDDMINAGGHHVFPKEVEDRLLGHPAVVDACVVAQRHEIKGQVPVAFVVPVDGTVAEAELKQWCLERGPAYAHPRRVYFRDALPLNGTGKFDRRLLADEADRRAGDG